MNDDVYPNDGFFIGAEPKSQRISRKKEQALTMEALPILQDLVQRMEARIAFYETISSIPDEVRTKPDEFLILANSHTLAAEALKNEKEYIQSLIDMHAPAR